MSESKQQWTPGPAHVVDRIDEANHGRRVVASGRVVAECFCLDPETNQANADLFAAAEDLYAELEDAAEEMEALAEDSCGSSTEEHFRGKADRYRRALAKARGEEACNA